MRYYLRNIKCLCLYKSNKEKPIRAVLVEWRFTGLYTEFWSACLAGDLHFLLLHSSKTGDIYLYSQAILNQSFSTKNFMAYLIVGHIYFLTSSCIHGQAQLPKYKVHSPTCSTRVSITIYLHHLCKIQPSIYLNHLYNALLFTCTTCSL